MALEVAVLAPALIALLLLVVFAGRVSEADGNVTRAAGEAARAASLRQDPGAATHDAERTARQNLAAAGTRCSSLSVAVDVDDFQAGGTVTVTVSCTIPLTDVALLGVPGSRTFSGRAVEVIDTYRGDGAR